MTRRGALLGLAVLLVAALCAGVVIGQTRPAAPAVAEAPCESGTAVANPADNPGLVGDCAVLLAVKDALRGTATLNWSADLAIGSWRGITLGGEPRRVTRIRLSYSGLNGTIPSRLGELEKLEHLVLYGNALTGEIPAGLGSLRELHILYLDSNRLEGGIPGALGNLSRLTTLALNGNRLTGVIPVELGNLWNLRDLYLEDNRLSGAIPEVLEDAPLRSLYLGGNSGLSGCLPAGLRTIASTDVGTLGLGDCPPRPRFTLTTSVAGGGGITPPAGAHMYGRGARVRVTAISNSALRVASWGGDCAGTPVSETVCLLTMDGNKTVSLTFERIRYTLRAEAVGGGSVEPDGTTEQFQGSTVRVRASWDEATHTFEGWSGDCQGRTATCWIIMDSDKTATATFAERCQTATDPTCIRVVYAGAPDDYTDIGEIPADKILRRNAEGRYEVGGGEQITVVTAGAPLPTGYARFYLQQQAPATSPMSVSSERLVLPVGTTYTFTVASDAASGDLTTFNLTAGNPPQVPDQDPVLGGVVVATTFQVPLAPDLIVISDGSHNALRLEWTGGPTTATRWQYRQRQWSTNRFDQWGSWTAIPSDSAATRGHTVRNLTADTAYEFAVRALAGTRVLTEFSQPDFALVQTGFGVTRPTGDLPAIYPDMLVEGDGATQWRIAGSDHVIVIPNGMRLRAGHWSESWTGVVGAALYDSESHSALWVGFEESDYSYSFIGREIVPTHVAGSRDGRRTATPPRNVGALFDQIVASLRQVALQ